MERIIYSISVVHAFIEALELRTIIESALTLQKKERTK